MDLVTLFPGPGAELLRDVWSKEQGTFRGLLWKKGSSNDPPPGDLSVPSGEFNSRSPGLSTSLRV